MNLKFNKPAAWAFVGIGLISGVAATIGMQVHAASITASTSTSNKTGGKHQFAPPQAVGLVTAISGNTINLTDKRSGTAYTIDASAATIQKFTTTGTIGQKPTPTTITVADIKVGDSLVVSGIVSGTNITATKIMDGMSMMGRGGMGHDPMGNMGTVSAISGNTITLTTKDGKSVTVDGSSATVEKISTAALSDIKVGDNLMAQGQTTNGTIAAKNIVDGQMPKLQNLDGNGQ